MPEHKDSDRHRPIKDGYPDTETEHTSEPDGTLKIFVRGSTTEWIKSDVAIPNKKWL